MPSLIKLVCPNCGCDLAEDNLHSNLLQCTRCNSYTYYESGMYNNNIFFGLLRTHTYSLNGLRSTIIDRYVAHASLNAIKNIKYLHVERMLVPVRELSDTKNQCKHVLLLAQKHDSKYSNIFDLLSGLTLDSLFNNCLHNLQPLRLNACKDETDSSHYTTHTRILPVGRTKMSVDTAYGVQPSSLLSIIYVPVFRISFNDMGFTKLCIANSQLTGLDLFDKIERKQSHFLDNYIDLDNITAISLLVAVIVDIVILIIPNAIPVSGRGIQKVLTYIIGIVLITIIVFSILFAALAVIRYAYSKLNVSLNLITIVKKQIIRNKLNKIFGIYEKKV